MIGDIRDNLLSDQPIYSVGDQLIYVIEDVRFSAKPADIYAALQQAAEVGPHGFGLVTVVDRGSARLTWSDVDADVLPKPSPVHGEHLDAATCVSEWMDWCDDVFEAATKTDGAEAGPHDFGLALAQAAASTWATEAQADLDRVHRELAREEVEETVAETLPRLDLHQMRRFKSMVSTWAKAAASMALLTAN